MEDVDLRHAKEHLEELLQRAANGEHVRITDARLGTIKLTTITSAVARAGQRVPGRWKDRLPPPPAGFFDPMTEEELKDWYGDDK